MSPLKLASISATFLRSVWLLLFGLGVSGALGVSVAELGPDDAGDSALPDLDVFKMVAATMFCPCLS